jgi:hypothetical protein
LELMSAAALVARLSALQVQVEALAGADRAAAREQMAVAQQKLSASRRDAHVTAEDGLRALLRQQEMAASEAAAEIGVACVAREVAATMPRLRELALLELAADRRRTQRNASTQCDTNDEADALRRAVEALQAEVNSQRKQANTARTQHEAQSTRHQHTVQRLEEQLAAERARARQDLQADADIYAKQVLQAEARARAAERRAENAEGKLEQMSRAAREWTGHLRTTSQRER